MPRLRHLVFFWLAMGSVAWAQAVEVTLSDGRSLQTPLAQAELVAELEEYAVIAGRSCLACDENLSLYVHPLTSGSRGAQQALSGDRYTYPGRYRDYRSHELVEKTRFFYGRCYEGQPALLWLTEYRAGDRWLREEYLMVLDEAGPQTRYNRGRQPGRFHIDHAQCRELPGISAETEP